MHYKIPVICIAALTLLTACERTPVAAATSPDTPAVTPSPPPTAPTSDPSTSSDDSPRETATSAAAAAPECKDLEKAAKGTCNPKATGNPAAK